VQNSSSQVPANHNYSFSFFDQKLIPYRYSSYCCSCWGDTLPKKPKAPSFQIGSG